jgi:hypothetical protein
MTRGGAVPPRLLLPAPVEVEGLLRTVEEALLRSGLRTVRASLSSVDGASSGAEVGIVVEEEGRLLSSRPPRRVALLRVEGITDDVDERARAALLASRAMSYVRVAGEGFVTLLDARLDVDTQRARVDHAAGSRGSSGSR